MQQKKKCQRIKVCASALKVLNLSRTFPVQVNKSLSGFYRRRTNDERDASPVAARPRLLIDPGSQ